jgi:hypothetical protein
MNAQVQRPISRERAGNKTVRGAPQNYVLELQTATSQGTNHCRSLQSAARNPGAGRICLFDRPVQRLLTDLRRVATTVATRTAVCSAPQGTNAVATRRPHLQYHIAVAPSCSGVSGELDAPEYWQAGGCCGDRHT